MTASRNKTINRNEQRKARQLAAEYGIKYTTALGMVREAARAARAAEAGQAVLPSWAAPPAETGARTAPQFLAPHPTFGPNGPRR